VKGLKFSVVAVFAIVAIFAVNAATAAAALPEFLTNITANTFTGTNGVGKLETVGKVPINCTAGTDKGEVTGAKTGTISSSFTGCNAFGAPANSLGDESGVILVNAPFVLCFIKSGAPLEVGLFIKEINVHIEIPLVGLLINVTGSVVARITPLNSLKTGPYTIEFTQAGGKAGFQCEGLAALLLSSSDAEHKKPEESGLEGKSQNITFTKDIEIDG